MSDSRVIKKYPNRRLYDTVESRYITLSDIRKLVMDKVDFTVVDKKSQEDITRSILLQVISEQEHDGEPLMSQDFLSQVIRSYGGTMQTMVGSYLEQSLKLFTGQQAQMRDRLRSMVGMDPMANMATLAHENMQRWQQMQEAFMQSFLRAGNPPANRPSADDEPAAKPARLAPDAVGKGGAKAAIDPSAGLAPWSSALGALSAGAAGGASAWAFETPATMEIPR